MVSEGGADNIAEPNRARTSPAYSPSSTRSVTKRLPWPFCNETDPMVFAQENLSSILQIFEVHLLHAESESIILDRNIKFVVSNPTRDVQVGRSDSRPTTVGNGRLGMDHGAIPFKDTDTRFEQRLVASSGRAVAQTPI